MRTSDRIRLRRPTLLERCCWRLSGCVNTSLIDRWKDPAYAGPRCTRCWWSGCRKTRAGGGCGKTAWSARWPTRACRRRPPTRYFPTRRRAADQLAATASREGFDGVHGDALRQRQPAQLLHAGLLLRGRLWLALALLRLLGTGLRPGYVETEYRADYPDRCLHRGCRPAAN